MKSLRSDGAEGRVGRSLIVARVLVRRMLGVANGRALGFLTVTCIVGCGAFSSTTFNKSRLKT